MQFSASNYVAMNPLVIKPGPFVITHAEIHERTEEVFGAASPKMSYSTSGNPAARHLLPSTESSGCRPAGG